MALFNGLVVAAALAVDQLSKWWMLASPGPGWSGDVWFVHYAFTPSLNRVFAFSLPAPAWLIYAVVAVVFVLVITAWVREMRVGAMRSLALALVIAGALGNLIDRLRLGGVIDFIEVRMATLTWSSFNIADALIVVGAVLMVWTMYRKPKNDPLPPSI
ncbi:MAG: signal peptidase II [Parcubacteria group bacterium]|nr:signal peptidase II [Parcubacteria group bacterium]